MTARRFVCLGATLSLLAALTACSSSSSGSSVNKFKNSSAVKGAPIVLADISELTGVPGLDPSPFAKGAEAAAAYLNSKGGIGGRPVNVTTCDSKNDPGASAACGQAAIADHAVAIQGVNDAAPAGLDKMMSDAGITQMSLPVAPTQFADPNWYPLGGGAPAEFYGLGTYMVKHGAKNISMIVADAAFGHIFAKLLEQGARDAGATTFNVTYFDLAASDFSSVATKAASTHPDAIAPIINGSQIPIVYGLLEQQGIKADQIYAISAALSSDVYSKAGQATLGSKIGLEWANFQDTSNPEVKIYRDAMEKAGNGSSASSAFAQWGFANVMFLANIGKDIGADKMNAAGVKKWFHDTFAAGKTPSVPVFMASPMTAGNAKFPSLRRTSYQILQWDGKTFKNTSGFFTPPQLAP
jgi:ABC-type branched-subunit amino acid transport system substrate-binding protein